MNQKQSQHWDRLSAAEKLFTDGEFEKALEVLETLPEEPEVLTAKAQNLSYLGQNAQAYRCLKKIVKSDPGYPLALSNLASFLSDRGQYKRAVKVYDCAIRQEPQTAVVHRGRAFALRLDGNSESALESYDTALKLDAGDGETWAAKADLLIELHRFPKAVECLEKASAAPSRSLNALGWSSRGSSIVQEGGFDEAIHCYDRALEQDPKEDSAILGKALLLERKGDLDGALACYDRMIEVQPDDLTGWLKKGDILVEKEHFDEALKCYQVAVELDSDSSDAWILRGRCREKLGQHNAALSDFERAITLDSSDTWALENAASCLYGLGRVGEAENAWRQALKLNPDLLWPNNGLGVVLAESYGKYKEALRYYDRAIKIDPHEALPAINKARSLIELRRFSKAQTLLEKKLEIAQGEDKCEVLYWLAWLYSEQFKKPQKALELYEQLEAMKTVDQNFALGIAEMLIRLGRHNEGRARASSLLNGELSPENQTVVTLLLYVSHALEGDFVKAIACLNNFLDRLIKSAKPRDSKSQVASLLNNYSFEGLADTIVNSSASLATKFELLVAIDFQRSLLVAPSLSKLREFVPLIQLPAAAPAVAVPKSEGEHLS